MIVKRNQAERASSQSHAETTTSVNVKERHKPCEIVRSRLQVDASRHQRGWTQHTASSTNTEYAPTLQIYQDPSHSMSWLKTQKILSKDYFACMSSATAMIDRPNSISKVMTAHQATSQVPNGLNGSRWQEVLSGDRQAIFITPTYSNIRAVQAFLQLAAQVERDCTLQNRRHLALFTALMYTSSPTTTPYPGIKSAEVTTRRHARIIRSH